MQNGIIGNDVQLLLHFALDISRLRTAQGAHQGTTIDLGTNVFASNHKVIEQCRKITGGIGV